MKRHIAWLFSCGLLVGCAPSPPPIDEPSAPTPTRTDRAAGADDASSTTSGSGSAPTAFHFKSGVLEIGDFDPYTLGDNIFDPCTEISPEEFAAAGFHNVEPIPDEYAGLARGVSACSFDSHPKVDSELIGNNNASYSVLAERLEILDQYKSEVLPEIFVYQPPGSFGLSCYAQLDTTRGGIVASAGIIQQSSTSPDVCSVAVWNLEKFAEPLL